MKTTSPELVGLSASRLQRIRPVMQGYIDRQQFAGITTCIARQGQMAHLETFGWQEIETQRPMAVDTIFRIYSMSKPITSVAVMMLFEEARLRLSDPLSRYLSEFKDAQVMQPRGNGGDYDLVPARREITIHDLLTHSSGLSYGFDDNSTIDGLYRKTFETLNKEIEPVLEKRMKAFAATRLPLAFHPGTAFRYSFSIDVLGYIVELVAEKPFDEFLQERIFDPLSMVDTAFWVPPEKMERFAAMYGPDEKGGLKVLDAPANSRYSQPTRDPSGGGGLVSTVSDYLRFGQMLLNGGELDGNRLLGNRTVAWMLQNHLPEGIHPNDEPANGFGLGGAVLMHPGLSPRPGSLGKFGWGGAANTEWWIDPVEEMQCLLMLQYMPGFTIPIVEDFSQLAWQALM